jgi:hypothetical protein
MIDTMLTWHIMTNYHEIVEMYMDDDEKINLYREVVTSLSRYFAYLMASVSGVLPSNLRY